MSRTGDIVDLSLRIDGMYAAVKTAIDELAAGDVAAAQVTLGHAENIERQARVDEDLELLADALSTRSGPCAFCGGSGVRCCEFGADR